INRELDADFDLEKFLHWEVYDPESGTAKSYLVSKVAQKVIISGLELEVSFLPWETIHTEISQKYDEQIIAWLAGQAGLVIEAEYEDQSNFYKNYIFSKKI
ncbi:MAG: L-histidine N(alpha)-methyltransferase, partial [Eudoraea sp.]|nr:L-histidine N(alpha)-methyltransferase [Eudoraea sp.]